MDIFISDKNLRRAIEDDVACKRLYGMDMAKKIRLRIAALRAADTLADFWPAKSGPERCHELKGDRAGTFSIDVKQPYRLLFKPSSVTVQTESADDQQRWKSITSIDIVAIEDTHG